MKRKKETENEQKIIKSFLKLEKNETLSSL
jgi:hypothetical protein